MPSTSPAEGRLGPLAAAALAAVLTLSSCASAPRVPPPMPAVAWEALPPLPAPVANNAVAGLSTGGAPSIFSFMGVGPARRVAAITPRAFRLDASGRAWEEIAPVPGEARLGAAAAAAGGRVYLLGGFTVSPKLRERTLGRVDVYDPATGRWSAGPPLPLPVDDALALAWRNRYVFVVGGWHDDHAVTDVQVLDTRLGRWSAATPIPGQAVYGHAGGLAGNTIVSCDGVAIDLNREERFRLSSRCFRGDLDSGDPATIRWSRLPPHPGRPRYRMAGGGLPGSSLVVFAGGARDPYNWDGVAYDGFAARPSAETFAYDIERRAWRAGPPAPRATMDHRGLAAAGGALYLAGGMTGGGRVTDAAARLAPPAVP